MTAGELPKTSSTLSGGTALEHLQNLKKGPHFSISDVTVIAYSTTTVLEGKDAIMLEIGENTTVVVSKTITELEMEKNYELQKSC